MNFALLSPKVWIEIAVTVLVIAAGWYGYHAIYESGADSVRVKWAADKKDMAEQSAQISADALATTKALTETIERQRSDTRAQISLLNTSLASAVAGLRDRPSRDSSGGVPRDTATGAAAGATGADLLRQDGEFLVREASRADSLRLQLAQCQDQYNAAREALR